MIKDSDNPVFPYLLNRKHVHQILHNHFGLNKISVHWALRLLRPEEKVSPMMHVSS